MSRPSRLLVLELRSALNFPLKITVERGRGTFYPAGPDREGEEELHVFEPGIFGMGDSGPSLTRPLASPRASWKGGRALDPVQAEAVSGLSGRLDAGLWLFCQWRPDDGEELADGMEWFAREAWWERRAASGDFYLRVLREDGRLAFQLLRELLER